MKRYAWTLLLAINLLWSSWGCGHNAGNEPKEELSEEEKSIRCDAARTAAADAYATLERTCTQDSDCTTRPIGGCGCPIPLSMSADTSTFEQAQRDAQQVCDEYYAGPGAQTCLNAVICDFNGLEGGEEGVICNAQGMCDEPPTTDGEM